MGPQAQIFLDSEGLAWLKRNKAKLPPKEDPVLEAISRLKAPHRVLEIGCANGWRLKELRKRYSCECHGIDPCITHYHTVDGINLYRGTADSLHPFRDKYFDLVIYGFCLYLCDPEDYFKIAIEGDRVLQNSSYMAIYDFIEPKPTISLYKHHSAIRSHKMDFATLWDWNPYYRRLMVIDSADGTGVSVLGKDSDNAFRVMK